MFPNFNLTTNTLKEFRYNIVMANRYGYKIDSFSQSRLWYVPICYELEWRRIVGNQDSAILYLVEEDTLSENMNKLLLTPNQIYKRIVLTIDSLKRNNC